jgi:NAD(P)H-dependent FMN reductase
MSHILGVVGSPRKQGNTHVLVERIVNGARNEGKTGEIVFLNGLQIRECDGCHVCWKGKGCSKKDDMNGLYEKIASSDAIIFGTPVYWYGPTALMKGFVDRLVYFNCPENRPKIRGKAAALAIPFEEEDMEVAAPLLAFFDKSLSYLEMRMAGAIVVPGVTLRGEVLKKEDCLEEAFQLGRMLAASMQRP